MIDRRLVQHFDWPLVGITAALAAVGAASLYSAVHAGNWTPQSDYYTRQLIWLGGGAVAMTVAFLFNYRLLDRYGPAVYAVCLLLLVCVPVFGRQVGGSQRWLALGPFTLQPSEPIKLGMIVMLARYYNRAVSVRGLTLRELLRPMAIIGLPFVLIVRQPDLGTAMLLVLIGGSMTLFVKLERRSLLTLAASGLVAVPLVWNLLLKGYQKQRVLTFLDPGRDPLGAGYHIIQSKIAIGSGMLTGKGFMNGTQNALSFLPEQHTDFIFSVLAEEWGFAGALVLLVLFVLFLLWTLNIAHGCRDSFGALLAVGIAALVFWQVFINIGMEMGLCPVVGVPLPFVSYGGSSTLTLMIAVGLLLNISMRRFMVD